MNDIAEGIGGAVEGALTGRAVESQRGEAASDASGNAVSENTCLNCGAHAPGNFCPQCGQKTHVHRTLSAIGHDLMHGVLHLDGKLWRTLPLLAFKPGQLTRRYIEGERASFVSPMAMFLFTVFAMFAVFQMIGLTTPSTLNIGDPGDLVREEGENQAQAMRDEIASLPEGDPQREQRQQELEVLEGFLQRAEEGTLTSEHVESEIAAVSQGNTPDPSSEVLDSLVNAMNEQEDGESGAVFTGIDALDEGILKKWNENPGLMLYKLQANAYKFSWLLIPLSIPFVWLTFAWRRRFKAYDHAIFVTYSLAFMSLLFIVASVLLSIGSYGWIGATLILLGPPIHLYKQLRGAYDLSRFSAFWRLMILSLFIWIVIALFLQTLFLIGAF